MPQTGKMMWQNLYQVTVQLQKKMKDRICKRLMDIFSLIKAKIAAGNPHTQVNLV